MNSAEEKADLDGELALPMERLKKRSQECVPPQRPEFQSLDQVGNVGSSSNDFRINDNQTLDFVDLTSNSGAPEMIFQTDTTRQKDIKDMSISQSQPLANSGLFEPSGYDTTAVNIENASSCSTNIGLGQQCQDSNWGHSSPMTTTEYNSQVRTSLSDSTIKFEKFIEEDFIVNDPANNFLQDEGLFSNEEVLETTKLENEASSVNVGRQVGLGEMKKAIKNIVGILNQEDRGEEGHASADFTPKVLPTRCRTEFGRGLSEIDKTFNPQTIRNGRTSSAGNSEYHRKLEALKSFKPEVISPGDFEPRAPAPSAIKGLPKQRYACNYCHTEFDARHKLVNHVRIHKGPVLHRCSCDNCGIPFRDYRTMRKYHNDAPKRG